MKKSLPDFVNVYDITTGIKTSIPKAELAPAMVRVCVEGCESAPFWTDRSQLRVREHQHPKFTGQRKKQVRAIKDALSGVYPLSLKEWEDGFRRDSNPDREIGIWLRLCECFRNFVNQHRPTHEQRVEAFKVLAVCQGASKDTVFELFKLKALTPAQGQQLVDAFFENYCLPPITVSVVNIVDHTLE